MTNGRLPPFSDNPWGSVDPPCELSRQSLLAGNVYCPAHVVVSLVECEERMGGKSQANMVSQKADERGIDKYMYITSPMVRERQRACSYTIQP